MTTYRQPPPPLNLTSHNQPRVRTSLSSNLRRNGNAFSSVSFSPSMSTPSTGNINTFPTPSTINTPSTLMSPVSPHEEEDSIPVLIPVQTAGPSTPAPVTPLTDPEVPPEIPQISNLRGGRGLMQRFPSAIPSIQAPTPPRLANPYATPDKTPRKPVLLSENPLANALLPLRTNCAICLDSLITLNGTLLECGNYAHRACLMTAAMSLSDSDMAAVCGLCGRDCIVQKHEGSASSSGSSIYSESSPKPTNYITNTSNYISNYSSKITTNQSNLNSTDLREIDCDVEPLHIKAFIHQVSDSKCEMAVRVACNPAGQRSLWRHQNAQLDSKKLLRIGYEILNLTPINHKSLTEKEQVCGKLRLYAEFTTNHQRSLMGYLFENCIVFAGITQQKTKYFYRMYNLKQDDLVVYLSDKQHLTIWESQTEEKPVNYSSDLVTMSCWISAINDKKQNFVYNPTSPRDANCDGLSPSPFSAGFMESNFTESIVCCNKNLVQETVTQLMTEMNPQDRLGLVIVGNNGDLMVVKSHKVSWPYWHEFQNGEYILNKRFEQVENAQVAHLAESLLTKPFLSKQQSIILAGSFEPEDLEINELKNVNYYLIGLNNDSSPNHLISSPEFRHYYASTKFEAVEILRGVYMSERHFRHKDVKINIKPFSPANIKSIEARGPQRSADVGEDGYEICVGSLLAGQYRTVLFDIELGDVSCLLNLRDLVFCSVSSYSTVTARPYTQDHVYVREVNNPHSPQFFFDRMVRRLSEKVLEFQQLNNSDIKRELELLSDETIEQVQKAVTSFEKGGTDRMSYVGEFVLDFDPIFSNEAMSTRAKHLAWGFCQLDHDLRRLPTDSNALLFKLVELMQTLNTQHSVICRNDLERIFFESMPTNKI